jgi:hypothetical protein
VNEEWQPGDPDLITGRRFGKQARAAAVNPVEWRPGDPQILVFAGTYTQAEWWAHSIARLPNRRAFRYVRSTEDLRGRRGNRAIMVGSFWDRPSYLINDLLHIARLMDLTWLPDYDVRSHDRDEP